MTRYIIVAERDKPSTTRYVFGENGTWVLPSSRTPWQKYDSAMEAEFALVRITHISPAWCRLKVEKF
ncbi:MAG: hypothetical protein AB7Q00_14695 [Phycisphaerales bacterium]